MRKRLVLAVCLIGGTALGVGFAPRGIKAAIETKYPYVQVGHVELGWPLKMHDVEVNRDSFHANLREVHATPFRSDPVVISGGTLVVQKGTSRPSAPSTEGRTILAKDLQVTVNGPDYKATLEGVAVAQEIAFTSGKVSYKGFDLQLGPGTVTRDIQRVSLTSLTTTVKLPFDLPKIPVSGTVKLEGIEFSLADQRVQVGKVSYGPLLAQQVEIQRSGSLGVTVAQLTVDHSWMAVGPLHFNDLAATTTWPPSEIHFTLGGRVQVEANPKDHHIRGHASCADWVLTLPDPVPEALRGTAPAWTGNLTFDVKIRPPKIRLDADCKFTCSAEPLQSIRAGKVSYMAYSSKGELFQRTVGRNIAGWTNIQDIPETVTRAFITLEDPGFLSHRGIIVQALQNSLIDNVKLGEFFRGGSTITQQLAKNLWLRRHKTISRKVHEVLLALALESCMSKEEILELYLNVVEFGPDLYGIGPAARHYFKKEVGDLVPEEGFFLASTLPRPSRVTPPDQGGMDATRRLMKQLISSGFLPEAFLPGEVSGGGWETME